MRQTIFGSRTARVAARSALSSAARNHSSRTVRTAFLARDERAGSAYPAPDIVAADLPAVAAALG